MKNLTELVSSAVSASKAGEDVFAKTRSQDITTVQKQAIKYFYERLSRIYKAEFRRQLPDDASERKSKAEFGGLIMNISLQMMDKGLSALHAELGDPDSTYRFMKLDAIIELVKLGGNARGVQDGSYKRFKFALPEPEEYISKRKKAAAEGISRLRGMFDND